MSATILGPDGKPRCRWCDAAPAFLNYHDTEWGFPVSDDYRLFEKLCLESFQSGLSWRTILAKRESFRIAFHNFDFNKIAQFNETDIEHLLANEGIIRHRGKIEATINNARKVLKLIEQEGSLAAFIWQYEPEMGTLAEPQTTSTCTESIALSKELKKRGWKFLGPTTVYAFMQAMGLINDHAHECIGRDKARRARAAFSKP